MERRAHGGPVCTTLITVYVNYFAPHAFLTPTSVNTRDLLTDAVFELLQRVGIADLTTGSLGRAMRTTPQAVLKRAGGRERLDRIVVSEFSRRWSRWCVSPARPELPIALPRDDIELHAVTVWHALAELARGAALTGRPELASAMEEAGRAERRHLCDVLAQRLGSQPSRAELDGLVAITAGVRAGLVRADDPLDLERAAAALTRYLDGLEITRRPDCG